MSSKTYFSVMAILALAAASPVWAASTNYRNCATTSGAVFALVEVDTSSSAWPGLGTANSEVVVGATAERVTMTTGTDKCGNVENNSMSDVNFPTSSAYEYRTVIHNATGQAAKFLTTYVRDAAPALGFNYQTVVALETGTCELTVAGSTKYYWKQCLLP